MQKHWLLGLILGLVFISEARAVTVISDIDDTIKVSHVNSIRAVIAHAPLLRAFAGMAEVYQGLVDSGAVQNFYYLSGSPAILEHHLGRFIERNDFPEGPLLLKHRGDPKEVGEYKLKSLRALFARMNDTVIVLGDDTERDADVYAQISREFPGRVLAIYIHRVRGTALSAEAQTAGATTFFTSMDLGVDLYLKGKLLDAALKNTAAKILSQEHLSHFISRFQNCPDQLVSRSVNNVELDRLIQRVNTEIQDICGL
jgi:hypothetical protein